MNKLHKLMLNGNYIKVNGEFINSIGYFAFDGCHKFYMIEDDDDLKLVMSCGYELHPDTELKKLYEKSSCGLKFIENVKCSKYYVEQFERAKWSEVKAPENDINRIREWV